MNWSTEDVAALAVYVGFVSENAAVAVAVSRAENGSGDDGAVNDGAGETPPDQPPRSCVSVGLWQINYCPNRDKGSRPDPEQLKNPVTNAQFAFQLSGGSNFGHWTTYNKRLHHRHLAEARRAVAKYPTVDSARDAILRKGIGGRLPGGIVRDAAGDIAPNPFDVAEAVARFLAFLVSWDTWRRALLVLGGAAAFVVGVTLIAGDSKTVQSVAMKGLAR